MADVLTLEEVAALLRVSLPTVRKVVREQGLPAMKLGAQWRFRREDVDAFMKQDARVRIRENLLRIPTGPGVYCIQGAGQFVKIGKASNIRRRVAELQAYHPVALRLLAVLSDDPRREGHFHRRFAGSRLNGEWFVLCKEIRAAIKQARAA